MKEFSFTKISFFFLLILFGVFPLNSQTSLIKQGKYQLEFGISYHTTSGFYNFQGDQISLIQDSSKENRLFTAEYKKYMMEVNLKYGLFDDILVFSKLPLTLQNLYELYTKDTSINSPTYGQRVEKANLTVFLPESYELGVIGRFLNSDLSAYGYLSVKIPATFQNGLQTKSGYEFKIYSSYEFLWGLILNYKFQNVWLETSGFYNIRTSDFSNLLRFHLEGGFSSIPNTNLKVVCDYVHDLSGFDNTVMFNQRETSKRESWLSAGAEFFIDFENDFYTSFSYIVRLYGKNTWSLGSFYIKAGFKL